MFLVTTADERTWEKDDKILFLGEWCKLYSRKHIWSQLNYETLPYHWDDRNKFKKDSVYLERVYEKYLREISQKLSIIHNCDQINTSKSWLQQWKSELKG
jgi:putative transferase (TIGR04331 family)